MIYICIIKINKNTNIMKNVNFTIGQRVVKNEKSMGFKIGNIIDLNKDLALVDFDNHDKRFVSISNLDIVY